MDGDEVEDEPLSTEGTDSDEFLRAVARAPDAAPRTEIPSSELTALAQFRILEKIGRGGMGIVYRAEDEKLRRIVALKVLPEDFDDDDHRRRRFLREARVAAAIAHPNVATIHEVGEADGRIYIAMELVTGATLRSLLTKGRLPIAEALRIGKDIARGLGKAHERGIAHRDLKPDNVMVSEDGTVKVLDFGLAKPTREDAETANDPENVTVTQEGRIIGTPGYMSPEQATGRTIDVRTDVFSLGVTFYEMLTGTRPFTGQTPMDALIATSRDPYRPIAKLVPEIPPSLEQLIARCLAKDPSARPASAGDVLAELDTLMTAGGRTRRKTWLAGAATALLLVSAGLAASRLSSRASSIETARVIAPSAVTSATAPDPSTPDETPSDRAESTPTPAGARRETATALRPGEVRPAALVAVPAASNASRGHAPPARGSSTRPIPSGSTSAAPPTPPLATAQTGGVIEKSPY